jgi:hypothetical protein
MSYSLSLRGFLLLPMMKIARLDLGDGKLPNLAFKIIKF